MDDRQLLTPQERQEFRELESMFDTPGWRRLKQTMQDEVDAGPAYWFAHAENWEQILAARARMRAVLELINYETITETRKANLRMGREYAQEDAADDAGVENF